MNQEFIRQMQENLLSERDRITESIAQHDENFKNILEDNSGKDSVDEAADIIDLKMLEALEAREIEQLELIDSALSRMDAGQYGICMKCGCEIPEERLEALPYALLCVPCKAASERGSF